MTLLEKDDILKKLTTVIYQIQKEFDELQKEVNDYDPKTSYVKTFSVIKAEKEIPKLQSRIDELLSIKGVILQTKIN